MWKTGDTGRGGFQELVFFVLFCWFALFFLMILIQQVKNGQSLETTAIEETWGEQLN